MDSDCGLLHLIKSGTLLLAMAKWFISFLLCHNSSSLELMRQLIVADPDEKICIRKPTVQKTVQCEKHLHALEQLIKLIIWAVGILLNQEKYCPARLL